MNPYFFGDSREPLFGVFQPHAGKRRGVGVLLCPPIGKEYIRTHWAMRQLAGQLCQAGCDVFRFDYHGTGDSAGATGSGDVARWRADVLVALSELRDTANTARVALVGLRLGAAIAAEALASEDAPRVAELVLWDPVISGRRYLEQLVRLQQHILTHPNYFSPPRSLHGREELMGFPLPRTMRDSIAAVDLMRVPLRAGRTTVFVTEETRSSRQLRDHLATQPEAVYRHVPDAGHWDVVGELEEALLVNDVLRAIVEQIAGARST